MAAGCGQPSMTGGFDAPNPAAKMHATVQAARTGDRGAIVHIVELLDSDDPAVRLLAINALRRLTGETHGYEFDAPLDERDAAIRRWVHAVRPVADQSEVIAPKAGALAGGLADV